MGYAHRACCCSTGEPCDGLLHPNWCGTLCNYGYEDPETECTFYAAQYPSIGYAAEPNAEGKFWAAWWNGIHFQGILTVEITIEIVRRTVVTSTGCDEIEPITGIECEDSELDPVTGCAITEYVDKWEWEINGQLQALGLRGDQDPLGDDCDLVRFPEPPPVPWPDEITSLCTTGPGDEDVNPRWWPKDTRYILPRWRGTLTVKRPSGAPPDSFPQIAELGQVEVVKRCGTPVPSQQVVDIDYPNVVIPSHDAGGACQSCELCPGGQEAAIGMDICTVRLIQDMQTMLPEPEDENKPMGGELATVWWGFPTDRREPLSGGPKPVRFRVLYGALARMMAGDTIRPGAGFSADETYEHIDGNQTWTVRVAVSMQPTDWCLYDELCGCIQSYSETCPTTYLASLSLDVSNQCEQAEATGDYLMTLEQCFSEIDEPTGGSLRGQPVERCHSCWKAYRNEYSGRETWETPFVQPMQAPEFAEMFSGEEICEGSGTGCFEVELVGSGVFGSQPIAGYWACGYIEWQFPGSALYEFTYPCEETGLEALVFFPDCYAEWPAYLQCCPGGTWTLYSVSGDIPTGTVTLS